MNRFPPRLSGRSAGFPVAAAVATLLLPVPLLVPASPADAEAPIPGAAEEHIATGVDLVAGPVPAGDPENGEEQYANLLTVDLTEDTTVQHVDGGSLTCPATVPEMAAAAEAPEGSTVVAAVNGGFFDIGATQAPSGAGMRDGHALTSPDEGFTNALVIDADGAGSVREVAFEGTVSSPSGDLGLDALNTSTVPADGLGLYTSDWGAHPREHVVHGPEGGAGAGPEGHVADPADAGDGDTGADDGDSGPVAEAVVSDGTVDRITDTPGSGPIGTDEQVLVARGASAEAIAALAEGDRIDIEHTLTADGTDEPRTVLGGRHVLVRDGAPVPVDDDSRAPRTAVGFSEDGTDLHVVTTDGRNPSTAGSTLTEVAELLAGAGADQALELDGGGSSTLPVREPGGVRPELRNRPGDEPREVPNGLVVTAPEGSAQTSGLWMRTALEPRPQHGDPAPYQEDPRRVFTGMHRTLAATGHDEAFGPSGPGAPDTPDDRTGELELSAPDGHGDGPRYVAGSPGPVTVTGTAGTLEGSVGLEVLPAPDTLRSTPGHLGLASAGDTASFVLTGVTDAGEAAPVEPVDAEVEADPDLAEVVAHEDGRFEVRAQADEGAGTVTVTAGGTSTEVPVSVGTRTGPAWPWPTTSPATSAPVTPRSSRPNRSSSTTRRSPSPWVCAETAAARV
ncbi:phosphodiester glycosidase family protein [Nocardiopsis kunsanensis]|uniref:phosphodiester glycosidase family protein n=1 Tax=Nocardiopsis kunsanensis TaxID=141693 RepID=UPI00034B2EC3|nr:phosphodiester glycosidase family protein [Nocardiopsis kunsanensis]